MSTLIKYASYAILAFIALIILNRIWVWIMVIKYALVKTYGSGRAVITKGRIGTIIGILTGRQLCFKMKKYFYLIVAPITFTAIIFAIYAVIYLTFKLFGGADALAAACDPIVDTITNFLIRSQGIWAFVYFMTAIFNPYTATAGLFIALDYGWFANIRPDFISDDFIVFGARLFIVLTAVSWLVFALEKMYFLIKDCLR